MKKFIQNIRFAGVLAVVLSLVAFVSCEEDDAELPEVTAGFTYTLDEDTGAVTFLNTSEEATMYSWDFGDGRTSKEINPMRAFGTGEYTITLTAKNAAGGSDTFSDLLVINIPLPMNLPVTFDDPNVSYEVNTFNGTTFQIVSNPDVSGSNDKASQVGEIVNAGNQFEGITFDVGMAVDLTTEKTITMNFWSETAIPVLLKLEQGTGADVEVSANHTGSGWESLQFDFNSAASYSRVTLFADGPGNTADTFYVDDIAQIETPVPPFDSGLLINGDFEAGIQPWIGNGANAVTEGGNTYNFVNVETAGEPFNVNLSQVVEITQGTNYILTFNASSDRARTILAGIGLNEAPFTNTAPQINLTTETQTFTLQLSAADFGGANSRVLFDMGADTGVVVLDNISLVVGGDGSDSNPGGTGGGGCTGTPVAATTLPLNFEGCQTFLASNNFGDGITSGLADNPSKTGINTSDYVLRVDKPAGSSFFAGIQNTFNPNFDLTTTNTFKLKVYSTKANVVFRFELAVDPQTVPVTGNPAPVFVTIPEANTWTEVQFTFTNLPAAPTAYNQLVIKPDNNQANDAITANGTYYLDDLRLEAAGGTGGGGGSDFDSGLLVNGDFEDGASPWTVGVGSNPAPTTTENGNTFYSVNVETAGDAFLVNLSQKLTIVPDATYTLTFDAWSDRNRSIIAGIGLSDGNFANTSENVAITSERTTYTLTLTANGFGDANSRVLFDNGGAVGLVNIDNVSLTRNDTGGGTGGGGGTSDNFITNGGFEAGETGWTFFQNGGSSILDNSLGNGSAASAKISTNGPSNPAIKQERFGAGVVKAGDVIEVKFDHRGSITQPGAVFNVLLFGETANGASFTQVFDPRPALTDTWTTFTATYTIPAGTNVSEGLSLLIESVCGGDAGCSVSANVDNVSVTVRN
ncbi:carbohydrate binding domain-containing protein [Leeuwenhoekiella sp. H156]|uniref:carbohydrate binding domain-containing protein n=1 Tax=Leeuwenhoekiella sp. H156 TaxID=3450128 RepID=UPI003FA41E1A